MAANPSIARWRWWVHVILLALLPLLVLARSKSEDVSPALPDTVSGLLKVSCYQFLVFILILLIARGFSRVTWDGMWLRWRGIFKPLWQGFAYSLALRVVIMVLLFGCIFLWMLATHTHSPNLNALRPRVEKLVDATVLVQNPVYFALTLTLVSFVVAGLREELWRAGMLAGINALFPRPFTTRHGRAIALVCVSILFGLGHVTQGGLAVGMTTLLGLGLGWIMLWHRSIWPAVIAHGFFDALTFVALYLMAKYQPQLVPHL